MPVPCLSRPVLVLALLASAWAGPCPAQQLEVKGPTSAPEHTLVRLEAAGPADDTTWIVFPIDLADGAKVDASHYHFTGPPGTYDVVLIGIRAGTLTQARLRVTIGSIPTPPGPTPPIPGPTPPRPIPIPPGPLSDRAGSVAVMAARVPSYSDRTADGAALATIYDEVAGRISRAAALNPTPDDLKPYLTPEGILAETARGVQNVLTASGAAVQWRTFFTDLRDYLNSSVAESGDLDEAADHVQVWRDIASGIRAGISPTRARITVPNRQEN